MDIQNDILTHYDLEILWLGVLVSVLAAIKRYRKRRLSREYLKVHTKDIITLALKFKPSWAMVIISVFFGVTAIIIITVNLQNQDTSEVLYMLGVAISTIIFTIMDGQRELSVHTNTDSLVINHQKYKVTNISKIELWDDLIYIELKNKKEVKFWLNYKGEHIATASEVIKRIEMFSTEKQIPIENNFAKSLAENEVLNTHQ